MKNSLIHIQNSLNMILQMTGAIYYIFPFSSYLLLMTSQMVALQVEGVDVGVG